MERESKHIIRQWNREIEDELRRGGAGGEEHRPWRAVVWGALWLVWLAALVALFSHVKSLR